MKVLLTGANGFIGGHITACLIDAGHQVVAVVRDPARFEARFPGHTALAGDLERLTGEADWQPFLDGIDAVVNCAGLLQASRDRLDRVHHLGPAALFAAAATSGVRRIVQISAVSITADTDYARTKRAGDEALARLDVDWVILRPSLVYAREAYGGTALMRALAAFPLVTPMVGRGAQPFTPIAADDLALCVLRALESDRMTRRIVEPCGPEDLTLAEIVAAWRGWLGLSASPVLPVPRPLVALACRIGDLLGSGPLRTTSLAQIEHGNTADPATFSRLTGIEPVSLATALARQSAGTADLWHARLYLVRPLITLSLALMWLVSGLVGLFAAPGQVWPILQMLPMTSDTGLLLTQIASMLDIIIAMMLLFSTRHRFLFWLQCVTIFNYTVILTAVMPGLWTNLFGPLLKNIPVLALVLVNRILQQER